MTSDSYSYIDISVSTTIRWEASVPWMYLDTLGNVTVGVGFLLPSADCACTYPFYIPSLLMLATKEEVVEEFNRVKNMAPAKLPEYYRSSASPRLQYEDIQNCLRSIIMDRDKVLSKVFTDWSMWPWQAKVATLDMIFNLGEPKLLREFPKFCQAVKDKNWIEAKVQCVREDISDARNRWTQSLLESC